MGFLLGVMIYMGYGYKSFLILLTFFFVGAVATRLGYAKKAERGPRKGGAAREVGARPRPTHWPERFLPSW